MAEASPMATIERLVRATNAHDVEGIVACFAEGYALESPLHPARSFRGKQQVRTNWTQILGAIPNLEARLVGSACDGAIAWTEWEMVGTRRDGHAQCMRGVFIFRVKGDLIEGGRMFLEPVDAAAADMNEGLRQVLSS
jgi:ketosteroid isomerase-like protein